MNRHDPGAVTGLHAEERPGPSGSDLRVEFAPWGPDPRTVNAVARALSQHPEVLRFLQGARHRLLSIQVVDDEAEGKRRQPAVPPQHFRATIYDYNHNRTVSVDGRLDGRGDLRISQSSGQPLPSGDEFDAAVRALIEREPGLGRAIRQGQLHPYRPMPPLIQRELPDGSSERIVTVGLLPRQARELQHEIVGVNLLHESVIHFEGGAPRHSLAHHSTCGHPDAGQATARNVPGQVWVTVRQGRTVLWRFLAVRPAASSGTNGSGIELRYVDYRGKRLLYRAHVPYLNVKYDGNACGPYLDWQNEEGMIKADGTNVAPGFRLCPTPAQTILDTGSDVGNFLGVGIYVQGQEVVLVSEMEAGWYRYVSQWRLHANGTIRPRFGFSAVNTSSCVCKRHHHHVYWRLDFDLRTPWNNVVREFNDPPLGGSSKWHTKSYEVRRSRNPARKRKWRVRNSQTGEAYDVIPGPNDGVATASPDWPFPRGDVWILRYRASEIDNGVVAVGPPYEAEIDAFRDGEYIYNRDVVLWYGAHFTHDLATEAPGHYGHIVGPTLKLVRW